MYIVYLFIILTLPVEVRYLHNLQLSNCSCIVWGSVTLFWHALQSAFSPQSYVKVLPYSSVCCRCLHQSSHWSASSKFWHSAKSILLVAGIFLILLLCQLVCWICLSS
jgi:hypothetical protein